MCDRLLVRLSPVFGPLARDVLQKLVQLDCLRKGGAATSYVTAESMMEYETAGDQLTLNSAGNGCRTLLRLHRNLGTQMPESVQPSSAGSASFLELVNVITIGSVLTVSKC